MIFVFYYYFTTLLSYLCLNIGFGYSCSAHNKQANKPSHSSNSDWHYYLRYSFSHYYYLRYSFSMFVTMTSENLMMTIVKRRWGTILACALISGKKCVVMFTSRECRYVQKQKTMGIYEYKEQKTQLHIMTQ